MRLGERLRVLRQGQGMTQAELADKIGVTRTAVVKYETGVRLPDNAALHRICDYFTVSTDYMLCRTDIAQAAQVTDITQFLKGKIFYKDALLTPEQKQDILKNIEQIIKETKAVR